MHHDEEANENFERDVPEAMRESILEAICEAAHDDRHGHEHIHIIDRDRLDSINVRAHGVVTIDGNEYRFIVESGDRNGFVLEDWEGDKVFEHHKPTQYALAPNNSIIGKHLEAGRGQFLIAKWDAFLQRPEFADLARKYAYDKHFAPGGKTESYWHDKAAQVGFVITDQETADEIRKRLAA